MGVNKKGGSTKTSGSTPKKSVKKEANNAKKALNTIPGINKTIGGRKNSTAKSTTKKASEDLRKQYENEEGYQTSRTVINWSQGKKAKKTAQKSKAAVPSQLKSDQEYKRSARKVHSAIPGIGKTGGKKSSQAKSPYENEEGYQTSQFFINRYLENNAESNRRAENFEGWMTGDYKKFFAGRDLDKKTEDLRKYYKNEEGNNPELIRYFDAEWKKAKQEYEQKIVERGKLSQGATDNPMPFAYHDVGRYEQAEWALQNAENWIEKYPGLGIFGQFIGNLSDNAAESLGEKSTNAGNKIYNMKIPIVSDLGAAMLGSDLDSGDSAGAEIGEFLYGAGTAVLGVGKGLVDMASDPVQTARSLNWLINKPEESVPAIAKGAGEYINKNIINGDARSRARAAGTLTVEIGTLFLGAGAAKGAKAADTVADVGNAGNKLLKGVGKNIDNVMPGPGTIGLKPSPGVIGNLDDAGRARSWYDKIMNPFDNSLGAGKKVKISNKVDDVGKGGSGATGLNAFKTNAQNRLNNIRSQMPNNPLKNKGNMATADVDIPGIKKEFTAHSKINNATDKGADIGDFSMLKPESDRIFKSYEPASSTADGIKFDRYHDTEAKILENVASQIKDPNISGSINLYTEFDACQSCTNIIFEFRRTYPNIKLNVISGQ